MDSMKIVMIAVVVSMPIGNIALPLANNMDLRECEYEIRPLKVDTSSTCNGNFSQYIFPCGAGQKLVNRCVRDTRDACAYCKERHYQPYDNICSTCRRCTVCSSHQRMVQLCTVDEDTKCEDVEPVDTVSPDVPSSPAASAPTGTTTPSMPSTVDRTTVDVGTFGGTSVTKITTGTSQEPSTTTPSGGDVSEDGMSRTVIALAVISPVAIIFAFLLVITLVCCQHYKKEAVELRRRLRRRDENDNQQEEEIELGERAADHNGYVCFQPTILNKNRNNRPPSHPPCRDGDLGEQCARPSQEPRYATVDKSKKSRESKALDPGTVLGVPLKSSDDPLQSPSSSSTRQYARRHPVCKAGDGERVAKPAKKKQEPGSDVEKVALLSSHVGSSKCNSKTKSPTSPLQSADDHTNSGASEASSTMNLTIPPWSASSTSTPSLSPPLLSPPPMLGQPAPLPSEEEPQLTVTSLSKSSSSSSLPPKQTPPSSSSYPPPTSSPAPLPPEEESLQKPSVASLPQSSPLPHTPPVSPSPSSSLLDVNSIDREQLQNSTVETENDPGKSGSENYHGTDHSIEEESGNRVTEDLTTGAQAGVSITPGAKPKLSKCHVGEGGSENEPGDEDITMEEQDTGCTRMARDGAGCLPSATPEVKPKVKGPDPGGDVAEKTREELKPLLDPDLVVTESFLDYITEVVNLELVERISRKLGLENVSISNRKLSLPNYDPKTIGFKILLDVRNQLGCKLTYREMLTTLKKCGQKNAGDKLIAEFGINMDLENI